VSFRLVVGLGNPGARYARTRHNVGFMVAEELLARGRTGPDRMQDDALIATARVGGVELLVARPQTLMNASGRSVAAVARRRGIETGQIVLVYDDADLPFGAIRVRTGGSPAGHRGVQSVVEWLATREVPRVRLGIGKDEEDLARRVLSKFTPAEQEGLERMISGAADAVEDTVRQGVLFAMNRYNRRQPAAD